MIPRRKVKRPDLALLYRERKERGECVACTTVEKPVMALPDRVWCKDCVEFKKAKKNTTSVDLPKRRDTWPVCDLCKTPVTEIGTDPIGDWYLFICHGRVERWRPDTVGESVLGWPQVAFRQPWKGYERYSTTTKLKRRVVE